jgi:predicted ArsR family transcriptional regulator
LQSIAHKLGENCEVIADFSLQRHGLHIEGKTEDVLSMLKRRPCSLSDISSALGMTRNEALKHISLLTQQGLIDSQNKDGIVFFSNRAVK